MSQDDTTEINYPDLLSFNDENYMKKMNRNKNNERIQFMLEKQSTLENKISHYEKIKSRWIKARRIVYINGIGITFLLSLSCGIVSLLFPPMLLVSILSTSTIVSTSVFATLEKALFSKKEKLFREKIKKNKEVLDRLYYYFEKCREDNIISLEELEEFKKINQSLPISKQEDNFLEEFSQSLKLVLEKQLKSLPRKN